MKISFSGFDWDQGNQNKNWLKHKVSCEEAQETFFEFNLVYQDKLHSGEENRYVLFGETHQKRLLLIAFTLRNNQVRIISARPMSKKERSWYEEQKKKNGF